MAIARLDSASHSTASSYSYSVSAGTDRLLVVVVMAGNATAPNVSGIDYGGQAMTEAIRSSFDTMDVEVWYLDDAGIAAASNTTVTVSYSAAQDEDSYMTASYTGVDQTTPVSESNTDSNTGSPNPSTSHDVTEANGNMVVSAGGVENGGETASWHADFTEQTEFSGTNMTASAADRLSTTDANISCEVTWTTSGNQALASVEFAAASGGASSLPERGWLRGAMRGVRRGVS